MPAVSRFGGLSLLALMACWTAPAGPPPQAPSASFDQITRDISGPYWCSIAEDGYDYPRYACVIKEVGEKLILAKLGGSQRLRGHIVLDDKDGFAFAGEMYCPLGDCQRPLHGRFKPLGRGGFKGIFREDAIVLQLTPAPKNAFGGDAYGGDGYGDPFAIDASYGGGAYGGASYAIRRNYRIDSRGRRRP